jgi:type IV secretory pathway VirD2 relaxase
MNRLKKKIRYFTAMYSDSPEALEAALNVIRETHPKNYHDAFNAVQKGTKLEQKVDREMEAQGPVEILTPTQLPIA